jgi:hypothetical protein
MSVLNINGGFGLLGFFKGWTGDSAARMDPSPAAVRPTELPPRRVRPATPTHVRDAERFEEDCERWDGLA